MAKYETPWRLGAPVISSGRFASDSAVRAPAGPQSTHPPAVTARRSPVDDRAARAVMRWIRRA